jgi:hypothetical protein
MLPLAQGFFKRFLAEAGIAQLQKNGAGQLSAQTAMLEFLLMDATIVYGTNTVGQV